MKRLLVWLSIILIGHLPTSHLALWAQDSGSVIASVAAAAAADQRVQKRTYVFPETGKKIPYALFVPSNYDPAKKWPLIVGLHGAGNPYSALMGYEGVVDFAQRDGYIIVTPLGYNAFGWYGAAGPGYAGKQDARDIRQALDDVERVFGLGVNAFEAGEVPELPPANLGEWSEKDVMNVLGIVRKEFNVDSDRIYLLGHSMGGGGAYHLAAKYPEMWAAIAVAAPVPDASLDLLQQFKRIPVLVLQGDADDNVVRTRAMVARMKQLGMESTYIEIQAITLDSSRKTKTRYRRCFHSSILRERTGAHWGISATRPQVRKVFFVAFAFLSPYNTGMALTKRQKEFLEFLAGFLEKRGYSPSYEEIADGLDLASLATVHKHILSLESKHYIKRGFNQSRSLEIAPKYYEEQRQHRQGPMSVEVPLLGRIAAGAPVEAIAGEDTLNFADFAGDPDTYALKVRGDSMIEDHICDGDYVLVQRAAEARDGDIVVALVEGVETTLKRFYLESGNRVRLQPANASMAPIYVPRAGVAIQGKLLAVLRKY